MTVRQDSETILSAIAHADDNSTDLAEDALALAALARPRVGLERYRQHLAVLANDVGKAAPSDSLEDRIEALRQVIAGQFGYSGDTLSYDDIQNANLMRIVDRRKGLPVGLAIFYIHAARAQGWEVAGLNFPGHFLIRLQHEGRRAILDPFNGGRSCGPTDLRALLKEMAGADAELRPAYFEAISNRAVLLRLQNNIKIRHLKAGSVESAIEAIEAMLLFAPDESQLWHEAGTQYARIDQCGAVIAAFDRYLELAGPGRDRHEATTLVNELKKRLN